MRTTIVIAYDATEAGDDGLALGQRLGDLLDADLIVARVLPDTPSTEATERAQQAAFHTVVAETRAAAEAVLGERPFELWPIYGLHVADGIRALAVDRAAALIVFGSPHRGPVGRVLLGSAAEATVEGAPCAVAVAPHGFARGAGMSTGPIAVAFDGSPEASAALDAGVALARAAEAD